MGTGRESSEGPQWLVRGDRAMDLGGCLGQWEKDVDSRDVQAHSWGLKEGKESGPFRVL